jgi:hypothetical protein
MRPAPFPKMLLVLSCALLCQACGFGDRDDVLILVREGDPVSRAIGDFYASKRDIASDRILELALPNDDAKGGAARTIDRAGFESRIAQPLESYLTTHDPDGEISILVTTRGIPLRIGHCAKSEPHYPRDCRSAAVDAALATLGRLEPAAEPLVQNANPFFGEIRSFARFRRDEPEAKLRFLVARLTAPMSPTESVDGLPDALRELIEPSDDAADDDAPPLWQIVPDAPAASRAAASAALFEPVVNLLDGRGHRVCDACQPETAPSGVILQSTSSDRASEVIPDRLAFPGLVISLAGIDIDAFDPFLARWLRRGARAISTHIDEPSLGGVTRPAIQLRGWADGQTAVEAHFKSVPHLGWVNVFVGDPLLAFADVSPGKRGDRDDDGIPDDEDNCLDVSNPEQRDSNGDHVGNRCDPDVDNDGRVDTSWGQIYPMNARGDLETIALTARNGPHDADHDLDGDGRVDENDVALAQLWLFRGPGPSGRVESARR